jgi:hypothetical protein
MSCLNVFSVKFFFSSKTRPYVPQVSTVFLVSFSLFLSLSGSPLLCFVCYKFSKKGVLQEMGLASPGVFSSELFSVFTSVFHTTKATFVTSYRFCCCQLTL